MTTRVRDLRGLRRALTLAECLVAMVVMGVALVASIRAVSAARLGEQHSEHSHLAMTLAQDMLAEIQTKAFRDSSDTGATSGPTPGELAAGNRSLFNDVNDYAGYSESPPRAADGSSLGLDSSWTRGVSVQFVTSALANSATDQGLAAVRVVVRRDGRTLATLSTLRSLGLPETQACALPDGSVVNLIPIRCQALGGTPGGAGTNAWTSAEPPDQLTGVGLVAHWKFDESSGTLARSSVSSNDATLKNGASFTNGKLGNAMALDGTNDHATAAHEDSLNLTQSVTLAAWVYMTTIPGSGQFQIAIHKGSNVTDWNYGLGVTNRRVLFDFATLATGEHPFTAGTVNQTNRWYHICATFDDATDSVVLYQDASVVGAFITTLKPTPVNAGLMLGGSPFGEYVKGRLDDVRIYNRALTADEVGKLFNGEEP